MENQEHSEIMHSLGVLEARADGIIRRLDLINGNVADNIRDIQELKIINSEKKGQWKTIVAIVSIVSGLIYFILNKLL